MKVPSYCRHKARGLAYVTIFGKEKYLGKYGSEGSIKRYERAIAEYFAALPRDDASTVVELCAKYLDHAAEYYVKDGVPTGELGNIKQTIRKTRRLYGELDVDQFKPRHLKALMEAWIQDGLCRGSVNRYARLVKRMFRWGVENEIVLAETYTAIQTVSQLRKGRTRAREPAAIKPIDQESIELTLPFCGAVVTDMIHLQLLTGMRSGELCRLKPAEINRESSPWKYEPGSHKTQHLDKERVIFIGPQAQDVLTKYLFQENPFGYDTRSYRRHIHRACDRAPQMVTRPATTRGGHIHPSQVRVRSLPGHLGPQWSRRHVDLCRTQR